MNTTEITNSQDIIDSRDIIARIEELESSGVIALDEIPQDEDPEDIGEALAKAEGK